MSNPTSPPPILPPRLVRGAALLAVLLAVAGSPAPADAAGFRLVMDNDVLADDADDLYSFGLGAEIHRGAFTIALREQGFTDRAAGVRFDETALTLGRPFALRSGWDGWLELGLVHTGRGLLGESAQNRFHDLIGSEAVDLEYVDGDRVHASARVVAGRLAEVLPRFQLGPYFELATTRGLQSHVLVAAQGIWSPRGPFAFEGIVGLRFSDAAFEPLEPWIGGTDVQAAVGVVYRGRTVLAWSTNSFGTGQEHLSLGYRIGLGGPSLHVLAH